MANAKIEAGASRGGRAARTAIDVGLVVLLAVVLLVLFIGPTLRHDHVFPVGPDMPVYLWWSRVAATGGIALVSERPGVVALIPTTGGALGLGSVPALAGLQYALGPAVGLAGAALVRGRGSIPRPAWVAGGFLAGVWATHLGGGYVANLALAAPFVGAAAALTRRTRRSTIGAAVLLGGGGLMHPQFFVVGAAVLGLTAAWAALRDRRISVHTGDAGRVLAALGAGAGMVAAGMLAATVGPARVIGDTSKDSFLRRVGEWQTLRETYLERFQESWRRYAPIMNTFLDAMGGLHGRGFARRFLLAWLAFTLVAVATGALTGWFPPDRILTFAFCVPLLASLGLAWLGQRLGHWWLAWPVGIVLVALTAWPTIRAWEQERSFVSPSELRAATTAGRIAATTEPGTPFVFIADDPETPALFLASHARNVARAAFPPDRAGDVVVIVGRVEDVLAGEPTVTGDRLYDLASRTSLADLPRGTPPVVFVAREFDTVEGALDQPGLIRWDADLASTAGTARPLPAAENELVPASPRGIAGATLRTFALLTLLGFGWARWTLGDAPGATAVAPAFGVATLGLAALVLERAGLGLGEAGVATAASALAGGCGYGLLAVRRLGGRRRRMRQGLLVQGQPDPHA